MDFLVRLNFQLLCLPLFFERSSQLLLYSAFLLFELPLPLIRQLHFLLSRGDNGFVDVIFELTDLGLQQSLARLELAFLCLHLGMACYNRSLLLAKRHQSLVLSLACSAVPSPGASGESAFDEELSD